MAAALGSSTFKCFNNLPKELRLLIWEYHFESARLHVVHPAPESQSRNPKREVLLFRCTILDSATNLVMVDGRPPSSLINREAHHVALSCKRAWTPVRFGKDLAESVSQRTRITANIVANNNNNNNNNMAAGFTEHSDDEQSPPVYVDWDRDMLYLCVSHAEQAFWSLRTVRWRDRVQKLAVLVPQSEFDRAIPFGPTDPIREVLESLVELEELLVVLVPLADVMLPAAAAAAAAPLPIRGLSRDAFGFVPYVDYLKKAGLADNHIMYARTAMSFREALSGLPKRIRLERVVDVDCLTCAFSYSRRGPGSLSNLNDALPV
ncbi:hypothetical protein M426DRAFT_224640 [Hypoxylon sp. CI-4A]|nr:hypothetical protein M426DRAFT_224640 [Hypoxylon sp. CI-4A]